MGVAACSIAAAAIGATAVYANDNSQCVGLGLLIGALTGQYVTVFFMQLLVARLLAAWYVSIKRRVAAQKWRRPQRQGLGHQLGALLLFAFSSLPSAARDREARRRRCAAYAGAFVRRGSRPSCEGSPRWSRSVVPR